MTAKERAEKALNGFFITDVHGDGAIEDVLEAVEQAILNAELDVMVTLVRNMLNG